MERVSLFVDMYNFLDTSELYLKQKAYIDFTKFHEFFIDRTTQIFHKTHFFGGSALEKMLGFLECQPRIDVTIEEEGMGGTEKCTDINLAISMMKKAFFDTFDVGIILSADRDFTYLIEELKSMGKVIGIAHPPMTSKALRKHADYFIELNEQFYETYWKDPDGNAYTSQIKKG